MFKIIELALTSTGIECELEIDGDSKRLLIAIKDHGEDLRAFEFTNLSPIESYELSNRDEFKPFQQILWKFVDGEGVSTPLEIVAPSAC